MEFDRSHFRTSLPVIVSVSPAKTSPHRLSSPSILRKCHSSFNSLTATFPTVSATDFKQLTQQHGINTVHSITQCLLDLTLIVSVHTALSYLQSSTEDYQSRYQHILDPMKSPKQNSANVTTSKSFIEPDILAFEKIIKQSKANIRNAQCKRVLAHVVLHMLTHLTL